MRIGWTVWTTIPIDTADNPDSDADDTEGVDYDPLPPPPKQAIEALEDVQMFLEYRGYLEQATSVGNVMTHLASMCW